MKSGCGSVCLQSQYWRQRTEAYILYWRLVWYIIPGRQCYIVRPNQNKTKGERKTKDKKQQKEKKDPIILGSKVPWFWTSVKSWVNPHSTCFCQCCNCLVFSLVQFVSLIFPKDPVVSVWSTTCSHILSVPGNWQIMLS